MKLPKIPHKILAILSAFGVLFGIMGVVIGVVQTQSAQSKADAAAKHELYEQRYEEQQAMNKYLFGGQIGLLNLIIQREGLRK